MQSLLLILQLTSAAAFGVGSLLQPQTRAAPRNALISMADAKPVVIGVAADSGCGKSTFMRRRAPP